MQNEAKHPTSQQNNVSTVCDSSRITVESEDGVMGERGPKGKFTETDSDGGRITKRGLRRVTVFLTADLARKLKVYAASQDLPLSDVVTDAVEKYLARRK